MSKKQRKEELEAAQEACRDWQAKYDALAMKAAQLARENGMHWQTIKDLTDLLKSLLARNSKRIVYSESAVQATSRLGLYRTQNKTRLTPEEREVFAGQDDIWIVEVLPQGVTPEGLTPVSPPLR